MVRSERRFTHLQNAPADELENITRMLRRARRQCYATLNNWKGLRLKGLRPDLSRQPGERHRTQEKIYLAFKKI
jgi:hypothetical protein